MALFKIYSGTADEFPQDYALHPGYAYFFEDSGELVIDTESGRIDVKASSLVKDNGDEVEFIDVDDVLIASKDGVTKNALLVGGEGNTVRAIAIDAGALVIGNEENGIAGLVGTGALHATESGAPKFGTLPITAGGTGATNADAARSNLDVYNKSEADNKVKSATSLVYAGTLSASGWQGNEDDGYTYTYNESRIRCGVSGDVHPIITYTSNKEEYNYIDSAEATVGVGILFTASTKPESDIGISIIDVG